MYFLRDLYKGANKNKNKYMIVEDGDPKHSVHCAKTNDWSLESGLEYRRVLDNPPPEKGYRTYKRQVKGAAKGVQQTAKCKLYSGRS